MERKSRQSWGQNSGPLRKETDTIKTGDGARLQLLDCRTWVKREGQWQLIIQGDQQGGVQENRGVRFGWGIRTLLDTLRIISADFYKPAGHLVWFRS